MVLSLVIVYGSMASGPIRALVAGARHVWQLIPQDICSIIKLKAQDMGLALEL
jgi:hypothetical protein